jgi:predicted nucleotidyltransferase
MVTQTRPGGLFGQTRAAVLALLLLRPDERFHLRQIERLTNAGLGAIQRELAALVRIGVLTREQSGRQVYFQANRESPFFSELAGLVTKTSGVADVLRAALAPIAPRINVALVFGSAARGALQAGSDVDLLVIARDLAMRELAPALRQAGSALGREINVNLYRPDEWAERAAASHPLANSVLREPRLMLIGDDLEFKRLGKERLARGTTARSK